MTLVNNMLCNGYAIEEGGIPAVALAGSPPAPVLATLMLVLELVATGVTWAAGAPPATAAGGAWGGGLLLDAEEEAEG